MISKFIVFVVVIFVNFRYSIAKEQEIVLVCRITEEIENFKNTKKNKYLGSSIKLFFNKDQNWLNDYSKSQFDNDQVNLKKTNFELIENKKNYNFKLFNFFSESKNKIESYQLIELNKFDGFMKFIKFYNNEDDKVFFSTQLNGYCNEQ